MIISGEASGDLHGAHLVSAMKKLNTDLSFCGMGGEEMRRQGVEILVDAAKMAVVGLVEVITHLGDIFAAQKILLGVIGAAAGLVSASRQGYDGTISKLVSILHVILEERPTT